MIKLPVKNIPAFLCLFLLSVFCVTLLYAPATFAATQQENLQAAMQEFESMCKDTRKGMWRDTWVKLEKRFTAIQAQGSEYAPEAFFYRARSIEELADRSKNKNDYSDAAKLYKTFTDTYENHALADNAAFNRAMLLSGPLQDKKTALQVLDKLLLLYPNGDIAPEALALRERLQAGATGAASTGAASATSGTATAANNSSRTNNTAATAPASAANEQKQKTLYVNAAAQWRTLLSNTQKAKYRENWLKLEEDFTIALNTAPNGPEAHKASYQIARCREELAKRSKLKSDWQQATAYFAESAQKYPVSSLADDALYAEAEILIKHLNRRNEGRAVAAALITGYPTGDMKAKAEKLLKDYPASASSAQGSGAGSSSTGSAQSTATQGSGKGTTGSTPNAGAKPAGSTGGAAVNSGKDSSGAASASAASSASSGTKVTQQKVSGSTGSKKTKAPASGAILRYMEWNGNIDEATLILELAGRAKYRRSTLGPDSAAKAPLRGRIELIGTALSGDVRTAVMLAGMPLASVNISKQSGGVTRVDLDLTNARSYKVTVLDNPYRLKIDISAGKVLAGAEDLRKFAPQKSTNSGVSLAEQLGLGIKTILIDAGHGGKDPGAVGNSLYEKRITLDLAKRVGAQLKKQGFNVIYTRETDVYVKLEDRTGLANSRKADIFISLHVNSSTNKKLTGLETYYLDVARSNAASIVAARENAVNVNATSDLQFILSDLTRNVKKEESLAVSKLVHNAAIKKLGRAGFKMNDNGVRSAPFHVLMGARMPAFLIEIGYISNSSDATRLKNAKYIQAMAEGICDGIVAYRKQINAMTAR